MKTSSKRYETLAFLVSDEEGDSLRSLPLRVRLAGAFGVFVLRVSACAGVATVAAAAIVAVDTASSAALTATTFDD